MKIEEGKYYRTRDGRKVGPMRRRNNDKAPWTDNHSTWFMEGNYYSFQEFSLDLISEWIDTTSPIREVTKRELVPGIYANGLVEVSKGTHPEGVMVCIPLSGMDANDLREAAHLFNQLAEFLE